MHEVERLSERERAALRLLTAGHDAKSAARALDLSVHTVNERLRAARAKLGVTSSREAARILAAVEAGRPQETWDTDLGVDGTPPTAPPRTRGATAPRILGGIALMTLIAIAAIVLQPPAADTPPRVVATAPAADSTIPPGPFTLSVTFDQPMRRDGWSFVQVSMDGYPDCPQRPTVSRDGRTFAMRCNAVPGARYDVGFNGGSYMNFRSAGGVAAEPARLHFRVRAR